MGNDKKRIIQPGQNSGGPLEFRDAQERQFEARISALELLGEQYRATKQRVFGMEAGMERMRLLFNELSAQLQSLAKQTQEHLNALRADSAQLKFNQEIQARTLVESEIVTEEQFKGTFTKLSEELKAAMEKKAHEAAGPRLVVNNEITGDGTGEALPDFDATTERVAGQPEAEAIPEGAHQGDIEPADGPSGPGDVSDPVI